MSARLALVGVLFLCCGTILAQQSAAPEPYTDDDAYRVFDALLGKDATASILVIQQETSGPVARPELNFSYGPERCVTPAAAEEFKDAISDYNRLNHRKWLLQRKFASERPYELLDSATADLLLQDGDWQKFRQRFPQAQTIFDMSAVGFSKDKTHAVVYFGQSCGNMCGEWSFYLLKKADGKWQEVPGATCTTVS